MYLMAWVRMVDGGWSDGLVCACVPDQAFSPLSFTFFSFLPYFFFSFTETGSSAIYRILDFFKPQRQLW